jgi:hypothetical protein
MVNPLGAEASATDRGGPPTRGETVTSDPQQDPGPLDPDTGMPVEPPLDPPQPVPDEPQPLADGGDGPQGDELYGVGPDLGGPYSTADAEERAPGADDSPQGDELFGAGPDLGGPAPGAEGQ